MRGAGDLSPGQLRSHVAGVPNPVPRGRSPTPLTRPPAPLATVVSAHPARHPAQRPRPQALSPQAPWPLAPPLALDEAPRSQDRPGARGPWRPPGRRAPCRAASSPRAPGGGRTAGQQPRTRVPGLARALPRKEGLGRSFEGINPIPMGLLACNAENTDSASAPSMSSGMCLSLSAHRRATAFVSQTEPGGRPCGRTGLLALPQLRAHQLLLPVIKDGRGFVRTRPRAPSARRAWSRARG